MLVEVFRIKYRLIPRNCKNIPKISSDYGDCYLIDIDDDLAMKTDLLKNTAAEAAEREINLLRKVDNIRNNVYSRLPYGIKPPIDTLDIALRQGRA